MKKTITILALSIFTLSCNKQTKISDKKVMTTTFKTPLLEELIYSKNNKKNISFKELIDQNKGKKTVIEIWASWCSDCIKGIPKIKQLQKDFTNINYVFISLDKTQKDWEKALNQYNLEGNHFYLNQTMKGTFGQSIDLDWIPRYILLDEEGKILRYKSIKADDQELIKQIENN